MPGPSPGDQWSTLPIPLEGSLIQNMDYLVQGATKPGSAIRMINFEPSIGGGYRRISGYTKYSQTAVTGTGKLLGSFVFKNAVIACRGTNIYTGTGTTWTAINGADTRTNAGKYAATKYSWVAQTITLVDTVNKPCKWDGTTYTLLTNAPAGASCVSNFHNHLFLGVGNLLYFSAPNDDTDYQVANGAGVINVGQSIIAIQSFRDALYIFCSSQIFKLTGSGSTTFALAPVSTEIGCLAADSVIEVAGDLYFFSQGGVRPVTGTDRIGDVEIGSVSRQIFQLYNTFLDTYSTADISAVSVASKSQYRVFGSTSAMPANACQGIVGCVRRNAAGAEDWEWAELRGIKVSCADSGFYGTTEYVIHGDYDGYVYQQEVGSSFDGSNVSAVLQLPYCPFGDPAYRKTMYKAHVYTQPEGTTNVTVGLLYDFAMSGVIQPDPQPLSFTGNAYLYDDVSTVYGTATYSTDGVGPVFDINLEGSGKTASFSFYSTDTLAPYSIQSLVIEFATDGRR